jgi:hypothetical protein
MPAEGPRMKMVLVSVSLSLGNWLVLARLLGRRIVPQR